jgi:hypothetical protein
LSVEGVSGTVEQFCEEKYRPDGVLCVGLDVCTFAEGGARWFVDCCASGEEMRYVSV